MNPIKRKALLEVVRAWALGITALAATFGFVWFLGIIGHRFGLDEIDTFGIAFGLLAVCYALGVLIWLSVTYYKDEIRKGEQQ